MSFKRPDHFDGSLKSNSIHINNWYASLPFQGPPLYPDTVGLQCAAPSWIHPQALFYDTASVESRVLPAPDTDQKRQKESGWAADGEGGKK